MVFCSLPLFSITIVRVLLLPCISSETLLCPDPSLDPSAQFANPSAGRVPLPPLALESSTKTLDGDATIAVRSISSTLSRLG
jgi:hypothetical protein